MKFLKYCGLSFVALMAVFALKPVAIDFPVWLATTLYGEFMTNSTFLISVLMLNVSITVGSLVFSYVRFLDMRNSFYADEEALAVLSSLIFAIISAALAVATLTILEIHPLMESAELFTKTVLGGTSVSVLIFSGGMLAMNGYYLVKDSCFSRKTGAFTN